MFTRVGYIVSHMHDYIVKSSIVSHIDTVHKSMYDNVKKRTRYLLTHSLTYLITYLLSYLLTYILNYSLTYSLKIISCTSSLPNYEQQQQQRTMSI